jgi:hypothetical protein
MVAKQSESGQLTAICWRIMSLIVVAIVASGCSTNADKSVVEFDGNLAQQPISGATPAHPIPLHHEEVTELSLDVTNTSDRPVTIAHVRLEGELLDLIFLTYDTGLHETLQPGEQRVLTFPIDFFDLKGQVHGLLRAQIGLYDPDRTPLATRSLVVDGRGGPWATMSTFNLVLLAFALASFGWNLYRLAQRRLPRNRFARGLRFLHSGTAAGLTLSAACSTLRIWPLSSTQWIMGTVVASLAGFAVGYLSPDSDPDGSHLVIDLSDQVSEDRRASQGPAAPAQAGLRLP